MARQTKELLAWNRGVISSRGLARIDLERMAMSAAIQSNYVPRVLGSMMLRPGFEFIDRTKLDNLGVARQVTFTFGVDDTAQLELTDANLRVRIDDVLLVRPSVSATVTNGGFATDLTGWTDNDEAGATSSWDSSKLSLVGTGENAAIRTQEVTVTETGTEHALYIDVDQGDVRLRVGSTEDDDDYISETLLDVGVHSLAFTPSGNFWIELANVEEYEVFVDECNVESSGEMLLVTPWSREDLPRLRWDQSGDVMYFACKQEDTSGLQVGSRKLAKIERRGTGRSWSVVRYLPSDGPFRVQNTGPITLTPSALSGEITITASKPFFKSGHAVLNSLWRIASQGQTVTESISAADVFTDPIRVVGKEDARVFSVIIEGTFTATVTLQFGFTADGPWNDISPNFTAPVSTSYDDGQDDQIIYYRLGIKAGDYSSGTATCTLNYTGGSIQGIARCNTVTSDVSLQASVLKDFGAITASKDWWEGSWSAQRGYPTAVELHEGRLWWAGQDKVYGSVSDGYETFDDNIEGDSAPIQRSIGSGPIRVIHWLISLGRLMMGTSDNSANIAAAKIVGNNPLSALSSSFNEPLTPTNFNIKTTNSKGVFVDRTKQRLYELLYDSALRAGGSDDYTSVDLSVFAPDFNAVGITQIAVQMKPDVRIHCVRSDGTVGMLVFDRLENVICWIDVQTPEASGLVEDVSVLPGTVEDQVYYIVKRTINSGTQRHLCKWALESEAIGGNVNKIADSFAHYSGSSTTAPFTTELLHLRDEDVVVWADGIDVGTHTVSATGGITLTTAASEVVAGLGYTAQFKSAKLGELTGMGLLDRKNVTRMGFIAENLHHLGVQYGPDFDNLSDLPQTGETGPVAADTIHADYHEDDFAFGGEWDTDTRICLQSAAPRPCTILAAIAEMESVERSRRQR